MAELDGGRLAAVLAADTNLQLGANAASLRDGDAHQGTDAVLVELDEGIGGDEALVDVGR